MNTSIDYTPSEWQRGLSYVLYHADEYISRTLHNNSERSMKDSLQVEVRHTSQSTGVDRNLSCALETRLLSGKRVLQVQSGDAIRISGPTSSQWRRAATLSKLDTKCPIPHTQPR